MRLQAKCGCALTDDVLKSCLTHEYFDFNLSKIVKKLPSEWVDAIAHTDFVQTRVLSIQHGEDHDAIRGTTNELR